jgi:triosephosphate isomerase
LLGVSLKMYLGLEDTLRWLDEVSELAPLPLGLHLFVLPSFPALPGAYHALMGSGVSYGAQDVWYEALGPYTGEVAASMLAELGCRYVAVGHAERRRLFGENNAVVARKAAAAAAEGLIPVVCVGEIERREEAQASREVTRQLKASLKGVPDVELVVAYEPVWAIGAKDPAPASHVVAVTAALKRSLGERRNTTWVLYGGAAGPGTLTALANYGPDASPDGLFLGRYAHHVDNLRIIMAEAATLPAPSTGEQGRPRRKC